MSEVVRYESNGFALAAELERAGAIRDGGLHLPPDLPWERYVAIGAWLGHLDDMRNWLIGDWLIYGEHTYGDKYVQAAEVVGLAPQTLMNLRRIAAKVPPQRRRPAVKYSHHGVVAALPPNDQKRLLKRAETERLSKSQLRRIVQEEKGEELPEERAVCGECGRPYS